MTKSELSHSGRPASIDIHETPYKASTPIKIPTRQRHILAPALSPIKRPLSPELIFEMSPINSSSIDPFFSSDYHAHYSPFVHRSLKSRAVISASASRSPPFMYPFPRPPAQHHCQQIKSDHLAPLQSPESFPSSAIPLSCAFNQNQGRPKRCSMDYSPLQHQCLTSAFEDDFENSPEYQSQVCASPASVCSRGRSRRRSNVFDRASALTSPPLYGHPRDRALVSRSQLSPQLISQVSGKRSCLDDLTPMDALEAEVNLFDIGFGRHLMRRTEDEKRVRVGRTRAVSSVQASFGG